jgi:hypothetical protein
LNLEAVGVAAERIDDQVGSQRRSAYSDVEDGFDLAKCTGLDRIHEAPHPVVLLQGEAIVFRISFASFCNMGSRAIFGGVDDAAGEQEIARAIIVNGVGQDRERPEQFFIEMGLRPVEMDPGSISRHMLDPPLFGSNNSESRLAG